ncbi:MAG TPA: hypothetical protein PKH07_20145, partial [bacterium]|nr:hypothetical protein [bacterium]
MMKKVSQFSSRNGKIEGIVLGVLLVLMLISNRVRSDTGLVGRGLYPEEIDVSNRISMNLDSIEADKMIADLLSGELKGLHHIGTIVEYDSTKKE